MRRVHRWSTRLQGRLASGPAQILAIVAVFLIGRSAVVGYSDWTSIRAMAVLAAFLGIAAMGQTLVVLVGGIDLSVPALIGAGNVMTAKLTGQGMASPVVIVLVLVAGFAVGALNGYVTSRWNVPALVVTLATGSVVGGIVLLWTDATLTGSAPSWLTRFTSSSATTGPLPLAPVVVVWLVLAAAAEFVLRRTTAGRKLYAQGVNPRAARLMLVGGRSVNTLAFACSGTLAALAGTLLTGFTGAGLFDVGAPYLFSAVAAVVMGGNSLLGGRGDMLRCALGAVILTELTTLLVGFSLSAAAQQAVLGALIVIVVASYGRDQPLGSQI